MEDLKLNTILTILSSSVLLMLECKENTLIEQMGMSLKYSTVKLFMLTPIAFNKLWKKWTTEMKFISGNDQLS